MMPYFGPSSSKRLETCNVIIQDMLNIVILYYDFSVTCGHRDEMLQNEYFRTGKSEKEFPDSNHNIYPSNAVDVVSWINGAGCYGKKECAYLAGMIEMASHIVNKKCMKHKLPQFRIRWGGDWDGDRDLTDQNFHDLPHIEIIIEGE